MTKFFFFFFFLREAPVAPEEDSLLHDECQIGSGLECVVELDQVDMIQLVHHPDFILHFILCYARTEDGTVSIRVTRKTGYTAGAKNPSQCSRFS